MTSTDPAIADASKIGLWARLILGHVCRLPGTELFNKGLINHRTDLEEHHDRKNA